MVAEGENRRRERIAAQRRVVAQERMMAEDENGGRGRE
jgi:hypothetical protein